MRTMLLLATATVALTTLAAPAWAGTADAPVPTAQAAVTAGDEVDRQIDAWVAASPLSPEELATPAAGPPEPRRIHGQVSVAFGNHGYRDVSGIADIPFGQTGLATVAVRDAEGDFYGHQHLQSLAVGISLGDTGRGGRGPACGGGSRYDSPLWARRLQTDGYGATEACDLPGGRRLR